LIFATPNLSQNQAAGESPAAGRRLWTIADYFIKALPETN
jgi:hypothetical protein